MIVRQGLENLLEENFKVLGIEPDKRNQKNMKKNTSNVTKLNNPAFHIHKGKMPEINFNINIFGYQKPFYIL